jgi:hypothetical protein
MIKLYFNFNRKDNMRLRLNQELRNKISSRWRVHAEQEETDEKEKYFKARESIKPEQDKAWDLTHTIVRRHYTDDDVVKARYLQNKFDNVDTIASDSCFHLGYMGKVEERDEDDNFKMVDKSRDRQLDCSKQEFDQLMVWQIAKGKLIQSHTNWIKSVLTQMKFIKDVIKGYKYLDEALEFAKESGLNINDAEIIRTNSTGLVMYNPKNAAEMLKSMKNKSQSRDQKILARQQYNQQQSKQ